MMASVMKNDLPDEDWLVMRARTCAKTDPYAAKAWMITARTLFPQNFSIQFEAYSLEKMAKNVKEAAKLLESLYSSFPHENKLWQEVRSILEALQTDSGEGKSQFLTEIFAAVPTHIQCQMLLSVAEKISDKLEQCRLLLLAMRKFPNLIVEHGLKLIDTLVTAETQAQYQSPVNCYRKLLVCDVLLLVLQRGKQVDIKSKKLFKWLQKAIEFYVSFITHPPCHDLPAPHSPDLMSPTKKSRRITIPGLHDKECVISDPWGNLFKILALIGQNLNWELDSDFFTKSREFQWQHILSLYNRSNQPGSESFGKQILYTTTVLFLECLYSYISSVDPEVFHSGSSSSVPLVMIEAFKSEQTSPPTEPSAKKIKAETPITQIYASKSVPNSPKIIQNFQTAFRCYELLHSSQDLQRDFISLCQNWRMETWSWMGHFQTDMFLYQGSFQEAIRHLQNFSLGSKNKPQLRNSLQLASFFYCMNNYSRACELTLDVIQSLPETSHSVEASNDASSAMFVKTLGRHLVLISCTEAEILPFCIQLLLSCFKEKAFSLRSTDNAVGHMIVLMQYSWPRHEGLFMQAVKKIQKQGHFTYNSFFNYVINIDILEEFAFIQTPEGGKVNLDILPVSAKAIAQQRTVTRGVNKGVKEDFRVTMEKQVRRSDESVEKVIRLFLTEDRNSLLEHLM
ncbi:hypothetical protein CHS0354_013417 [Potamilus streckersoni]|uniref:Integrator complex subunit 10 n=1 Tax=Potamilus streckersoni TaxID=2493646 RepID=A0AAE0VKF7_9BIVA|nr:hypothetical protein CHS0354_013417 [Potamilus streckersoni]